MEDLAQIGEEGLVSAQRFAGGVRQFGDRLAVARHQFHDDVQRWHTVIVRQIGADAKAGHAAIGKVTVQGKCGLEIESVRKYQALRMCVDAQLDIVRQGLFAPYDWIARVVAQPVE